MRIPKRKKEAMIAAQGAWEKARPDSRAEKRALLAWLSECRTKEDFAEIYREIKCPSVRFVWVIRITQVMKDLGEIHDLCEEVCTPPKKTK